MTTTMAKRAMNGDLRLSRRELFSSLGYVPHAGQREVHKSKAKRRVLASGVRWGKSTVAVYEAIAYMMEPRERLDAWIIAPSYELTRRTFDRVVEIVHHSMPHRIVLSNQREHVIRIMNLGGGVSELRARSADRPAGLLGAALDVLIIDECDKVRADVWSQYCAPRLLDRDGHALLISTPGSVNSWFYSEFRRAKKDAAYQSFSMPTASNPHVSAELIEAERARLPEDTFRSQYLGDFLGRDNTPCDTCHGPKVGAKCFILLLPGQELGHCPTCGELVNEDGETAVSLDPTGERMTTVIIQGEDSPENPEPLPDIDAIPDYARTVVLHPPIKDVPELPDGID